MSEILYKEITNSTTYDVYPTYDYCRMQVKKCQSDLLYFYNNYCTVKGKAAHLMNKDEWDNHWNLMNSKKPEDRSIFP